MVRSGTARAIRQTGGIVNITGGYICGFSQSSNSTSNDNAFGGAILSTAGQLNILDGAIAANSAQNGGAIYGKGDSQITISGGYISGNVANRKPTNGWNGHSEWNTYHCGGGGIYLGGQSVLTMNAGYITHNIQTDTGYFDGGGGILLTGTSKLTVNNGFITGNKAQGGGGIYTDFGDATEITIVNGHISANVATHSEGAGISIDSRGYGKITGGYITNNQILTTVHWGGGGLFCADGATLELECALITNNKAGGFGAGVAGCPTGHLYLYVERGCAIYDNTDMIEIDGTLDGEPNFVNGGVKDDIDTKRCVGAFLENGHSDYFCALDSTVTNAMLGGSFADWQGTTDGDVVNAKGQNDIVLSATEVMGLKAHPSDEGKLAAQREAKLYINGNYSYTHGGGIMCNGNLIVGIPEDVEIPVHLSVQGTKSFVSNTGNVLSLEDNNFLFTVTDKNGTEVAEGRCDENGKITFDKQIVINTAGTHVYEIKEKIPENANSDVQYDTKKYKLMVVVERDQGTAWYGATWKYTHNITSLVVEASDGGGSWNPVVKNETTQSGVVVVLPDEKMISFTNIQTDVVDMKVVKNWVGDYPDDVYITVHLHRGDEVIDTRVLNSKNNWQYTWPNLPTKDNDGNAYSYRVEEDHVDGYITTYEETNETVISTTNITNTNINDAKFSLDLTKVSEENPELTLAGAEFELVNANNKKLYFVGGNGVYTAADSNAEGATTTVITVEDGKLLLNGIPAGTYTLKETKAPEGYDVMKDVKVILDEFSEVTVKLTLEDPEKAYAIPETGGIGTNWFIIGGILLMLGSLLYGYKMLIQRERRMKKPFIGS